MAASFAAKLASELGKGVFLVLGKHGNAPLWHYVRVPQKKLEAFKRAVRSGSLDVADYGEVLFSGWGKGPPPDIRQKIKQLSETAT